MPRVSLATKYYEIFTYLCKKGEASLSEIALYLIEKYGMKYHTVRPTITKLYKYLEKHGLIKVIGTDKYGAKIIKPTEKTIALLISTMSSYSPTYIGFNPKYLLPVIEDLCPNLSEVYKDLIKIFKVFEDLIKEEYNKDFNPHENFVEEFLYYAVNLEQQIVNKTNNKKYTCEDVLNSIEAGIYSLIERSYVEGNLRILDRFLNKIIKLELSSPTRDLLRNILKDHVKDARKEYFEIRERISILNKYLKEVRKSPKTRAYSED